MSDILGKRKRDLGGPDREQADIISKKQRQCSQPRAARTQFVSQDTATGVVTALPHREPRCVDEITSDSATNDATLRTLFMQRFAEKHKPVVIRAHVSGWPALKKWNLERGGKSYLRSVGHNDDMVRVGVSPNGTFSGQTREYDNVMLPFGDFLELLPGKRTAAAERAAGGVRSLDATKETSGNFYHFYLCQSPIYCRALNRHIGISTLSNLGTDIPCPSVLSDARVEEINLWISCGKTQSTLHYDENQNLLCVVDGSKAVRLLPPRCVTRLRPNAIIGASSNHSTLNMTDEAWTSLENDTLSVELFAGDALFIPEGKWS